MTADSGCGVASDASTKAEVVAEIRKVAKSTRTQGAISGHSVRVTGAQRLALSGVNETRLITFGRWASVVLRKCVREAVLGINGRELVAQVEQGLQDGKVYEAFEAKAQGAEALELKAEFKSRALANPMESIRETELLAKWQTFLAETRREEQSMEGRTWPKLCRSEAGSTYRVANCRLTHCRWHWSRTATCKPVEDIAVTCRKCAGSSVRWGR